MYYRRGDTLFEAVADGYTPGSRPVLGVPDWLIGVTVGR